MRFIDTNIIAYAFYNNEHTQECQKVIREGGLTDTVNLVEAFFIIEKETGSRETAIRSIKGILKSNINISEIDVNLIFEALKIAAKTKLSIFDALHYTCAM